MAVNMSPPDRCRRTERWLSTCLYLTDVGGQRGGCQHVPQRKGACFLLNKKEALSGLIQVNDDKERKGGQAGSVYGFQL